MVIQIKEKAELLAAEKAAEADQIAKASIRQRIMFWDAIDEALG